MIWFLACAHAPLTDALPAPADFSEISAHWSREAIRYDGFSAALIFRATYESTEFAEAREHLKASRLLWSPEEQAEALSLAKAESAQQWIFTLAASNENDARPTISTTEAPWRLRLLVDGRVCSNLTLTEREPDAMDHALYPWLTHWNNVWRAEFARDCGNGSPILQLSGPLASAELHW